MKLLKPKLIVVLILFTIPNISAQISFDDFSTAINGLIINQNNSESNRVYSDNGKYSADYKIGGVTDENRELFSLNLFENTTALFTLQKSPGSDFAISNSGYVIFFDHSKHFEGELKIYCYSKFGEQLFKKTFLNADQFSFSENGNSFGIMALDNLHIVDLILGKVLKYEKGSNFAISEDGSFIAIVQEGKLNIYSNTSFINSLPIKINFIRKVKISSFNNIIAVINKRNLVVYDLTDSKRLFSKSLNGDLSFKDLKIFDDKIVTGIHKKTKKESSGILRTYNFQGNLLDEKEGNSKLLREKSEQFIKKQNQSSYDPIPWPFAPFDSMRTVWNHYEQHMGLGSADSYLHQGLDLITPIGEPTYSVIDGYVKLVLTIGGASYWRIAISDTQSAGRSDGWLSAHLIENTIQFDVGDTVQMHDYLGDIIQWSSTWGHIHFVNISDTGMVWLYSDNEWGINFNPILALQPYPDTTAPYIDPVFAWSKFAFAVNESATYLDPDSLIGNIDIIVKVVDYVGDSEWQQPAYTTWFTIKRISDGEIIKPKTLGHILNHKYPFYDHGHYIDYAGVIYQRDNTLLPSGWNDPIRNYYHNLTNNNGDSLVELSEKSLAFNTENYPDGDYRIIVEVYDESGNFDIDSMDVKFKNGNPVEIKNDDVKIYSFDLEQNYPNPFNPTTKIKFTIPNNVILSRAKNLVTLKIYDVLGNEIATLVNEEKTAGTYEVEFNGKEMTSGIYFYQINTESFIQSKKMILLK